MKKINLGSSETTCKETSFNLLKKDKDFYNWFIGFTEGDGSFVIPTNRPPQFEITQHIKDISVLYKIKKYLGFGSIIKRKKRNVAVYQVIGNYKSLIILAYIFNGHIRCPAKQKRFSLWINKLKNYVKLDMIINESTLLVSINDSWFSGFTDAEGHFSYRIKISNQLSLSFQISQKTPEILLKIINAFKLNNKVGFDKSWNGYRFSTENSIKRKSLIRYFNRYPLKTQKKINYLRWKNLSNDFSNGLHLSDKGIEIIKNKLKKFKV